MTPRERHELIATAIAVLVGAVFVIITLSALVIGEAVSHEEFAP